MYKVYMHIVPNNKKYIGVTKNNPKYRWGHGSNYKKNRAFYDDIIKFGWENIEHIILYDDLTMEEAKNKEIELISFYNTKNDNYGYNKTSGGEIRLTPNLESRLKQSNSLQHKRKTKYKPFAKTKRHRKGKSVICIETNLVFPRIKDASEYYRICDETIRKCCHNKRFTAGGYHWCFYEEGGK